jgi:predicted aldo/keto reductase-like oxidoreductase
MQYRTLGRLKEKVSALGFGTMRLPTVGGVDAHIDETEAAEMMAYAIDRGVNYVDTGYPYHGGASEPFVGRVLAEGYRDKVLLAAKMPTWAVKDASDFDRYLNEQLRRLRTDHFDIYLLHCLHAGVWARLRGLGIREWMERAKGDGRFQHLGFSFHDSTEVFRQILDDYDWPLCQIQHNYMNEDFQAGTEGLRYAASKGVGVVVMEPLQGGGLAQLSEPARQRMEIAGVTRTPADLALQWLWHKPEVSLVLSGMSDMEQVRQNVASAAASGVGALTQRELDLVGDIRKVVEGLRPIPCTQCRYCMPCPHGVDIPLNFRLYNDAHGYGRNSALLSRNLYQMLPETARAGACEECGECEPKCPQDIEIVAWHKRVHREFSG